MKFNQKGFNDTIAVTIIGGIIGALFITGVFIWQEANSQKEEARLFDIIKTVVKQDTKIQDEENADKSDYIMLKKYNSYNCYGYPGLVGFPPRFREVNTVEKFMDVSESNHFDARQQETLTDFLTSEGFNKIKDKGEIYEICFHNDQDLSFVMYGDLRTDEKATHKITITGIFDDDTGKLVTNDINLPSLKGMCTISKFIEDNMLIDCSMADGGWYHELKYLLDKNTNELILMKDCSNNNDMGIGEDICNVNYLD